MVRLFIILLHGEFYTVIIKQIKEKFAKGYLGSQVSISVNSMITLHSTAFKIYKTLTDKKTLSILHCLNV